jgi:CBS domain-containing protein
MEIQSLMSTHVYTIESADGVTDAARSMKENDVGCLVVTDGGTVEGIITDRDLVMSCMALSHNPQDCHVSEHMVRPAIVEAPSTGAAEVAHIMAVNKITRMPIVDGTKLVGMVSFSDIALALDIMKQSIDEVMHDLLQGIGGSRSAE